jgi:Tol biopolymer transport system component
VNTAGDERDPWLSPDGKTLFFAAYNDGDRDLFTAQVIWE